MLSLKSLLDRLGPPLASLLVACLAANGSYLVLHLMKVWGGPLESIELENGGLRGNDFIAFWTAAKLALSGELTGLYDPESFAALQSELLGIGEHENLPWLYPPLALPLLAPLGLLPFNAALLVWQVAPLLLLLLLFRRLGLPLPALLAAGLSGAAVSSLTTGQNGVLLAALLLLALMVLPRRPLVAGLLLGLLAVKPQWAAGVGLVLLLAGEWRILLGMGASAMGLAVFSVFLYGLEPWYGFLEALQIVQYYLADVTQRLKWHRLMSLYVGLATLGVPAKAAFVAQGLWALAAAVAVAGFWRVNENHHLRAAALAAMVPLMTPYFYDYDTSVLLVAYGFLLSDRRSLPISRMEMLLLMPAWLLGSMWLKYALIAFGFAAGFLSIALLLVIVLWRGYGARRPSRLVADLRSALGSARAS